MEQGPYGIAVSLDLDVEAEEEVGLLLPCNVIVFERGDRTVVAALDPSK